MEHLYLRDGEVNPELYQKSVVIYGCGNDGRKLFDKLLAVGAEVVAFCDSDKEKVGKQIGDVKVVARNDLAKYQGSNLALAFFKWREVFPYVTGCFNGNLFADFPYETEVNGECILCGNVNLKWSKAHFAHFLKARMFLGKEQKTKLCYCPQCGMHFSEYRPNDEEMKRLYKNYRGSEYVAQREKYEADYAIQYEKVFRSKQFIQVRKSRISSFLQGVVEYSKISSVLDYGGDDGRFIPDELKYSKKYVYDISGCDVCEDVTLLTGLQDIYDIEWDMIMCCHLLEHVAQPIEIMENIVQAMSDKTLLYLELPFEDIFYSYSDFEINEHINFFTVTSIERIAKACNLHLIRMKMDNVICALFRKRFGQEE